MHDLGKNNFDDEGGVFSPDGWTVLIMQYFPFHFLFYKNETA